MNIGYACQCLGVEHTALRTCTKRFATTQRLDEIIQHNLSALSHILAYNVKQGIKLFRISSDLIPFGSIDINPLPWRSMYQKEFHELAELIRLHDLRVSMHPGQYTILNALNEDIVTRAIADLRYHCDILNLLEVDFSHKMVLHVGGIYGDKQAAMQRFERVYQTLDEDIKRRLVIENDDRYYTLEDVLFLSQKIHAPIIFDNLHHELLPSLTGSMRECMELVQRTWKGEDGNMKVHYSRQDPLRRRGAHAPYLATDHFLAFCQAVPEHVDVMLEIKEKNLAALHGLYVLHQLPFSPNTVWKQYRYLVASHSMQLYHQIQENLINLTALDFFRYVEQALSLPQADDNLLSCFQMILDTYTDALSEKQLQQCEKACQRYQLHELSKEGLFSCFNRNLKDIMKEQDYLFL